MSSKDESEINTQNAQLKQLSMPYDKIGNLKVEAEEIYKVLQYSMENYKAQDNESSYIWITTITMALLNLMKMERWRQRLRFIKY